MKNNPLNDIIRCDIEISNPASNSATFDSILIIVPGPSGKGKMEMTKVTSVSRADELLDYGFTVDDTAYLAATTAFSQNPAPAELLVCIREITVGDGASTTYEDIKTTLARASEEAQFYGIHLTEFKTAEDVQGAIEWTETQEKIFGFEYDDIAKCPIQNNSYYRSFGLYSGKADGYETDKQPKENKFAALAWMAKCFGYEPGTETWHLKELATLAPSVLGTEDKKALEEISINSYRRYAGCNVTFGGTVLAGEWIDVIRFRDWLKAEMQSRVFTVMKGNRKVPFTDAGIGMIEGVMKATLKAGQDIGGIAPTEYDENDEAVPGYSVHVPMVTNLSEAERKSRKLTGCRWSARLSGAIHLVEIGGNLTF